MKEKAAMHNEAPGTSGGPPDWTKMWQDALSQWASMLPQAWSGMPLEFVRQAQSAQLKWWSQYWDHVLRSPFFLDALKNSLASATQARKQMNDALGEMRHEFQGVSRQDADHIDQALRRIERRVRGGIKKILRRLDLLSRRVAVLENGGSQTNGSAKPKVSARRSASRKKIAVRGKGAGK